MKNTLRIFIILFLFLQHKAEGQSGINFQNLFSLFDTYKYEELDNALELVNLKEIPAKTFSDSINKNLTKLLLLSRNKIVINGDILEDYINTTEWLMANGMKKLMPYFINDLSYKSVDYKYSNPKIIQLLNQSILISKEFPNQSHLLSEHNILVSLDALSYLDKLPHEKFNKLYKIEKVKFFKINFKTLDYFNQTIFYDYLDLTSEEIDNKIKEDAYLNAISLGIKLGKDTKDILSLVRLYRWLVDFDIDKLDLLSTTLSNGKNLKVESLINQIYVSSIKEDLIIKLEEKSNANLTLDEIKSLEIFFGEYGLRPIRIINQNEELSNKNYWFKFSSLHEAFSEKYLDDQSKLFSLGNIITLIKYIDNSEKKIKKYELKKFNLINKIVDNNDFNMIDSNNFFDYIRYGLDNQLITSKKKLSEIFVAFNREKGYDESIVFLDKYWDYIKGYEFFTKINLNTLREEIEEKYLKNNDANSIKLKIKITDTNEKADVLLQSINLNKNPELELLLLEKKYMISKERSHALNYLQKIQLHLEKPFIFRHIYNALDITIAFKLDEILVISNKIREEVDKEYFRKDNLRSLSFYLAMGYYYKYLKRKKDSKYYFLKAISNPYYFDQKSYGNPYTYINSVLDVDFTLFDLEFDLSDLSESEFYQNEYEVFLYNLDSIQKNNSKNNFSLNDSIMAVLDMKNYEMNRRIAVAKKDFISTQEIITTMIDLSDKFNLNTFDLNDMALRLDYVRYKNGELSLNDYRGKLINNTNIDNMFKIYSMEMLELDNTIIFDSKLSLINRELNQITLVDNLNYDSKTIWLSKFYDLYKSLENTFFEIDEPNKGQLTDLLDVQVKLDNIDSYNSSLLKLNDEKTEQYFAYLNEYFSTTDFETRLKLKNEFEVFQEKNKTTDLNLNKGLLSLQNKLKDNQAYIRFSKIKNNNHYVCYIIKGDKLNYLKLDDIDFERIQNNYTNSIISEINDKITYNYFFKPIEEKLGIKSNELFIKNDGLSNNINLEAILINDNKYAFDKYKITYVEKPFSINRGGNIKVQNAFLFGNPNFGSSKTNSNIRAGLNQLPYTKDEIDALNKILINANIEVVKTDLNESTEDALYENSNSNIVHIATHGFYLDNQNTYTRFNWGLLATNAKSSLRTGISKKYENDGIIYGSEILIKNFTNTELLVLSACETGVGVSTNLGIENLSNSFIRAGAKRVISTLWPIDDKITQEFMIEFYNNLMINLNPNESLINAKIKIKEKYTKPKFWAPFILIDNSS